AGPEGALTIGIRAEHLRLHGASSDAAHRDARVKCVERLSDQHLVHVRLDDSDQELIIAAPAGASFEPGEAVRVELLRPLSGSTPTVSASPHERRPAASED